MAKRRAPTTATMSEKEIGGDAVGEIQTGDTGKEKIASVSCHLIYTFVVTLKLTPNLI